MKSLVSILLVTAVGCTTTPTWWYTHKEADAAVVDRFLWAEHLKGAAFCATYDVLAVYPAEVTGPVLLRIFERKPHADDRQDIIRAVAMFYKDRGKSVPKELLPLLTMGARDDDPEVRELSSQYIADIEQSAEQSFGCDVLKAAPEK